MVTEEGPILRRTRCHLRASAREEWKDSVVADSEEAEPEQEELEEQEEYGEAKQSEGEHQGVDKRNEEYRRKS